MAKESTSLPNSPPQHIAQASSTMNDITPSTTIVGTPKRRRASTVSRVDMNYFDPKGFENLQKTLSRDGELAEVGARPTSFASSVDTLTPVEGQFDLVKTLRHMIKRREAAGVKGRELGVMFRELRVIGIGGSATYQPTVASTLNPKTLVEAIQHARHPPVRNILDGFEGVVRPGEMLLVLGRPGSGCTTFLKTMANRRDEYYSVEGDVHYNSISPKDLHNHFRGDVQYCPEDDIHFPTLTVDETLQFAAKLRAPQERLSMSRKRYRQVFTEILATIFGLRHARGTPVGDAAIRGVSGGEKKRVSIAEALATRSLIGAWDNSTRGLDASTALEFVQALRIATDMCRSTTIVSIYQAGESLYRHFDKVCVIYEGKMAYFGPADRARQYFIDLGYEPANRQTTADFLVAVTDPKGRIPRQGFSNLPRSAAEFAASFKNSPLGKENRADMTSYEADFVGKTEVSHAYKESAHAEYSKYTNKKSPYVVSIPMQIRAVMLRRAQILRGNKLAVGLQMFSFVFQSLIVGSVFFKSANSTSAYFSRGGVIFFALLFSALTSMAEIPALYFQRPIVHRHERAALYHPFIEAVALTLVDLPITFISTIIFAIILYFMVGLQSTVQQFFIFYLFLFSTALVMKTWFRGVAAAFRSEASAQAVAGISILVFSVYTGYTIPKPTMIGALRWLTYINPFRYSFEAMLTNEFRTLQSPCASLVPQGPGYENVTLANQVCTAVGAVSGQPFVDGKRFALLSYGFSFSNAWKNFGILIAFWVVFTVGLLLFSEFNTASANESSVELFKRGSKEFKRKSEDDEETSVVMTEKPTQLDEHSSSSQAKKIEHLSSSSFDPTTADVFSWQRLNYVVPIPGQDDRKLLDDISGYVAPGKITALMGESGAGKTTLLNVLAKRTSTGVITGDLFVNGHELPADFQSQTGYCQQMDTHVPTATVREALLFSAKLRQPPEVPLAEKEAYVEKCLKMCGLEAYADVSVGSLNIEHRKRTTIGVELAAKPKLLLFLDEPTSGLDSQSAWGVVSFLRNLADSGQAILCTIHQPSAELFEVFDRLLLLRKGGQTVYFGDIGHNSVDMINYFEEHGARKCQSTENPAEYMLDVIGAGATATSVENWSEIWRNSTQYQTVQNEIQEILTEGRNRPALEAAFHSEFATNWTYQTWQLVKRDAEAHWRDPTYIMAKLVLNVVGGLFIGFTFFQSKDTQQGTQNKLFAFFMLTILSVPLSNQLQVPFIAMRSIYEIRERPSRMYDWTALVASQQIAEIPWNIFGSMILFFCTYWTVGFESSRAGYTFLMLAVVFPIYYTSIGQLVAAMSANAEIAAILFSFLFSFVIMFNGVLQPFRQLGWWRWMYRLSPFTYLIEGLLGQAIGNQLINCSPIEFALITPPTGLTCSQYMDPFMSYAGGYLANPSAIDACQYCASRTTNELLGPSFNIFYEHRWRNFGIMIAFSVFNIVVTYVLSYLFRFRSGPLFGFLKRSSSAKK